VTRAISQATADWIVQGPLVDVVESGTARRARLEGITVFAKTGTAQTFDLDDDQYATDRYVSSCVCGAPAEAPTALVLVTVNEAQSEDGPYGGVVAAPTAARILRRALEALEEPASQSPTSIAGGGTPAAPFR
jgi:cell division protein FtsI/penicillin-binding protein 2